MFFQKYFKKIAFATILIITLSFLLWFARDKGEVVTVKCTYMMYACGDCQPQYNIVDVVSSSQELDSKRLIGRDIYVEFNKSSDQDLVDNSKCIICHVFELTGTLNKEGNTHKLYVENSNITLIPDCCE